LRSHRITACKRCGSRPISHTPTRRSSIAAATFVADPCRGVADDEGSRGVGSLAERFLMSLLRFTMIDAHAEEVWWRVARVIIAHDGTPLPSPTARLWNAYSSVYGLPMPGDLVCDDESDVLDALDLGSEQIAEWCVEAPRARHRDDNE
jgi:hypothetical protein